MMTAKALRDLGLTVTVVKAGPDHSWLYCSDSRLDLADYLRSLLESMTGVEVRELPSLPEIQREGFGFYSDFGSDKPRRYGCLFLDVRNQTSASLLQPSARP